MATSSSCPLLLPQNRKLRHLQGLYIRNLTLSRPRGHTTDDTALLPIPKSLEHHGLHHAHSSSDLLSSSRPGGLRRRSTNLTPGVRQRRLENVIEERMVDAFFSLHVGEQVVYVSEVVERVTNPCWRDFELEGAGGGITRADTVVLKVWVKRNGVERWGLLLEEEVRLRGLRWVGKGLEGLSEGFGANAVVLRLVDGMYVFDVGGRGGEKEVQKKRREGEKGVMETSSYSALMRLSNLDESIQDALAMREELAGQINRILRGRKVDESPQAEEVVKLATKYVASEKKMLKASIRRRAELKASIAARSKAIQTGNEVQAKVMEDINNAQDKLSQCRTLLATTTSEIHGQRRRICEELLAIFPIEPTSHPLLFTICGLPLPNSTFEDADEDLIAAALGYVARLVDMLQYYLSVPLTYPITCYGSRSIIQDLISILQDNQRTFPLYMKGTVRFRFDYAVFLLNKNIECLAESQGLKVLDIRQTLPNLKYLLYVCSAGSSELPARKAGGIRGLILMREGSRRGSEDSGVGNGEARRALESAGKEGKGGDEVLTVPFGGNGGVRSLRTSGLRENVR
ncbi:uncharacterized protein LY89DRAFT_20083 [Mollisia scopiformis]|uniref:Autophagy-related protein 14 n=1 Tax=Mollisia scopiformis TaxID=149040 RepID=A0A194XWI0_MOLSC|nr:uncharacterized protein LY89DRAFT_20083 [Mollisia scopiformis]KUJ24379.1 hypothetical protein LY89DRAFT_20083 [Mollisia scopiformis]